MSHMPTWMTVTLIVFVGSCAVVLVLLYFSGYLNEKIEHDFGMGYGEWPPEGYARCHKCGICYAALANCGGLDECKGGLK